MIVLDASVLVNALADDGADGERALGRIADTDSLVTSDHIDLEVTSSFRRRWLAGDLTTQRFSAAIDDLEDIRLHRYPIRPFLRRIYELRSNVTPYDAAYVALAEAFECTLVTADARLARAPGLGCPVEVLS